MKRLKIIGTIILSSILLCSMSQINTYANETEIADENNVTYNLPDLDSITKEISNKLSSIGVKEVKEIGIIKYDEHGFFISVSWKCVTGSNDVLAISAFYYPKESTPYWDVILIEKYKEDLSEDTVFYYLSDAYLPFQNVYDYETGQLSSPITCDAEGNIIIEGNYYCGSIDNDFCIYKFCEDGIVIIVNCKDEKKYGALPKAYAAYEIDGRKITISSDSVKTYIVSEDGRNIYLNDDKLRVTTEMRLTEKELIAFK